MDVKLIAEYSDKTQALMAIQGAPLFSRLTPRSSIYLHPELGAVRLVHTHYEGEPYRLYKFAEDNVNLSQTNH